MTCSSGGSSVGSNGLFANVGRADRRATRRNIRTQGGIVCFVFAASNKTLTIRFAERNYQASDTSLWRENLGIILGTKLAGRLQSA